MTNSCQKGKRGEREVAELLRGLGIPARRGQQFSGGEESPDVVADLPGVHIEVKRTEALALYPAMRQAKQDAAATDIPTVWHRRNGEEWVVVLPAEDFVRLVLRAERAVDP